MSDLSDDRTVSIWLTDAPKTHYPSLDTDAMADVAVIGGGITGLTTALLLQRAGLSVCVLEADRIGCGITGMSTAKATSLQRMIYSKLERKFDESGAHTYADANEGGLAQMRKFVQEFDIDCQWETQSAYTYTRDEKNVYEIREEVDAACRAGLSACFTMEAELPVAVIGAVRLDDQAQFLPYNYCLALARLFEREGGRIFENSRARELTQENEQNQCRVHTEDAELTARHVVLATLLPVFDRGGYFVRTYPSRSYGIAATLVGPAPNGMYISVESPTRSVRPLPNGAGIIVIGEEHKVGQDSDTRERYAALKSWTREYFPVREIVTQWSAQDYISVDSVPYIGKMPVSHDRVWVATGFGKWGLTMGTAAAMIISDSIQGRENPWAKFFDSTRADVLPSAKKFVTETADVAKHFVGDRLKALVAQDISDLVPGEGGIVKQDGEKVAAYRDDAGVVHACSPVCTHMGCFVQWNSAEKSWDCPCHGSRFHYDGAILQGPAVEPLESRNLAAIHADDD